MRNKFPGYYKPTKEEFEHLWNNATIALDANVLLDFYRFSEVTTVKLFEIIEKLKDRIWLPYKVSYEYHDNLNEVISRQINSYQDTIKTLEDFKKLIDRKRSHPFLEQHLHEEIERFCSKFDEELLKKKTIIEDLIIENPIKEKLSKILNDNIGDGFTEQELQAIYNEGALRYAKKQPPGYMDEKNKQNQGSYKLYGDLIVWKSIIREAKRSKCCIILVTGDTKEDWFQRDFGKIIGPRPELIHEFRTETGQLIYIYPTNTFLRYANEFTDTKIDEDTLEEIGEVIESQTQKFNSNNQSVNINPNLRDNEVSSRQEKQSSNFEESSPNTSFIEPKTDSSNSGEIETNN